MPDVVFLGNAATVRDLLSRFEGRPTLTLSAVPGFAKGGGMIELAREGGRIRLEVNLAAAGRAGLRISSKVLGLARAVYD